MSHNCLQQTKNELQTNVSQLAEVRDNTRQHIWMLEGQMCNLNQTQDD